ncbi:MAG: GTPase HflX, partial [Ahrensia sp.]
RATLEEVEEADLVIHVHDISDPQALAQSEDVEQVLSDLDIDADDNDRVLNAFNKIDALDEMARGAIKERCAASANEVAVSAITGEGVSTLLQAVEDRIAGRLKARTLTLRPDQYAIVAWLYDNAIVRSREDRDDGNIFMDVSLTDASDEELNRRLAAKLAG